MTFDPGRIYAEEAKRTELAVVAWSYTRGSSLSTDGESAIDVVGYGAQIVVQLGTHVVKMKLPTAHVEQERKVHGVHRIAISTPTECVRHVANRDLANRRIVPFSGVPRISMTGSYSAGSVPSMLGRDSVRSLAATRSNIRRMRQSVCLVQSWIFSRQCPSRVERNE